MEWWERRNSQFMYCAAFCERVQNEQRFMEWWERRNSQFMYCAAFCVILT